MFLYIYVLDKEKLQKVAKEEKKIRSSLKFISAYKNIKHINRKNVYTLIYL